LSKLFDNQFEALKPLSLTYKTDVLSVEKRDLEIFIRL